MAFSRFFLLRYVLARWILVATVLCISHGAVYALQSGDSLRHVLSITLQTDTNHINARITLSILFNTLNYDSTKYYAQSALDLSRAVGWRIGMARAYRMLGFAYQRRGMISGAVYSYTEAIPIFEEYGDYSGLGECYNGLGIVTFEQGLYSKAIEYYKRSVECFLRVSNYNRVVAPYMNLAYTFLQEGQHHDSARWYNEKARQYSEPGNEAALSFYLINEAILFIKQANLGEARKLIDSALAHPSSRSNIVVLSRAYYLLGDILLQDKKLTDAVEYYTKGLEIAKNAQFLYRMQDGYNFLARAYYLSGNMHQAYLYRDSAVVLHDSLLNERTIGQIESLQSTVQQAKITILEEERRASTLIRNSLIVITIMGIGIVVILIRANRQRAKTNQTLLEQKSALKQANIELSHLNEQLTEANQYKVHLMSIVSHDLKNPLGAIQISTEMAQRAIRKDPISRDMALRNLDVVLQSVARMVRFISDLLDMTSAEAHSLELKKERFNMSEMMTDIVRDFALTARNKQQTITVDVPLQCFMTADKDRLRQVLDNLISNALKYSPPSAHIHTVLDVDARQMIRIRIADEGPGFKPEDFDRLFQSFQKLSARPTGGESSTGIGLTIAKQMTELHGGTIEARNRTDHTCGAEFILHLPLNEDTQASGARYTMTVPDALLLSASLRVLEGVKPEVEPPTKEEQAMMSKMSDLSLSSVELSSEESSVWQSDTEIDEKVNRLSHGLTEMASMLPPELRVYVNQIINSLLFQEYDECVAIIHQFAVQSGVTQHHVRILRDIETAAVERQIAVLLRTASQTALSI
jgi:signal transduction histidine kinase